MREELSAHLKHKREAAGLSQGEVSRALGYTSAQFVSNWERGLASPPMAVMPKLMKLYSLGPDEVINLYLLGTKRRLEAILMPKSNSKGKSRARRRLKKRKKVH